ncbi:HAD family hydrolase [Lutibacter citreus]|uniref:HAD family hydrolase n=1 Tax=Lutibacter citreus TaxID=2138210 RepID=UPI000DBE54D3|nr:HAD family hydrolase [Lutibacter citreus]
MKYKAVIFDLDGTLVNSLEDIADSMNTVLKKHKFPTHSYEAYQLFIGNGIKNLVSKALPEEHKTEALINSCFNSMIHFYRDACTNKTKPYTGIIELLDYLVANNIKLGVFSNKADELTKKVTATLFPNYFEYSVGLTIESLKKPNPFKAVEISKKLGLKPEEIIFIGDTEVDMQTAKNAKMLPVGVLWGYRSKEELISNGAKHILNVPLELNKIV